MGAPYLSLLFIFHHSRQCFSTDRHLIYAEHAKDFMKAEDGPLKDNSIDLRACDA